MTLAIISHTEHYRTSDGTIVGWGPTVNEINHLLEVFDRIYHVAMLYEVEAPESTMAYTDDRVVLVPLRPSGGRGFLSKLHSIWEAPGVIRTVSKTLKQVDCFQLRAPTGIGVYLIPYLTLFSKKKGWFKYAGNWNQKNPPLGYRLQRFMLKHQKRKVTINGQWEDQPKHCITFENPCLTLADLELGKVVAQSKTVEGLLTFCFVGRLEGAKGVEVIIRAFGMLTDAEKERVDQVHFVGDGDEAVYFKKLANDIEHITIVFHGFLSKEKVFKVYESSHFFMLPSMASEGFPKVIAEAMNFGCIPIVSDVSAISHYINATNGLVLSDVNEANLALELKNSINLPTLAYCRLIETNTDLIYKFSFEHYNARIKTLLTIL